MKNQLGTSRSVLQDSLTLKQDSLPDKDTSEYYSREDTVTLPQATISLQASDSLQVQNLPKEEKDTNSQVQTNLETKSVHRSQVSQNSKVQETIQETTPVKQAFNRYNFKDTAENQFGFKPIKNFLTANEVTESKTHQLFAKEYQSQRLQLNFTLIIGIVSIFLLLTLKRFYQKFISQVAATMVNFQLAEKMLREKNIIVRRAFFLLNLNFVLVLSLFFLNLTIFWQFTISKNYIFDYFIILGIVVSVIFIRIISLYITGFLFGTKQAIAEHIHISFLVNKNLGLIMLPVVFIIIYTSTKISEIAIYLCLGLLVIATFYKILRGFQIIIRNGVLIFYAFLYLCTLELLPLVLGSKLIISLR